jgi:hypothetical protein
MLETHQYATNHNYNIRFFHLISRFPGFVNLKRLSKLYSSDVDSVTQLHWCSVRHHSGFGEKIGA